MATQGQRHDRSALILYGSETGNSQDVAVELGNLVERLHFCIYVSYLDAEQPAELLRYSIVFIVISTTGQGDLPGNARKFWKSLLRKSLPRTYFKDVHFTTFGLGDSSYPKFNWAARKIHKRISQLGAKDVYPRGEADEQHSGGIDASFLPWSMDLRRHLLEKYPLTEGFKPIPEDSLLPPLWLLSPVDLGQGSTLKPSIPGNFKPLSSSTIPNRGSAEPLIHNWHFEKKHTEQNQDYLHVILAKNQRVTSSSHWQDVRHIELISQSRAAYAPGDVVTIFPKNTSEDVERLLVAMDWNSAADQQIEFKCPVPQSGAVAVSKPPLPFLNLPCTLRGLLTDHLDFTAIPRRSFFATIAHFTDDPTHKERLLEFASPDYVDELYDYTTRPRRSIIEVLQEFESVKIPWQWAAHVLPELRGRQFSIASGGQQKTGPDGVARFELLVAIVKYKTILKKVREGVCTRYLASLPVGTGLSICLQIGGLGVSKANAGIPVVMVGPGTGLAPMRSLIWERSLRAKEFKSITTNNSCYTTNGTSNIGESVLFFGCRKRDADYFYEHEWEELAKEMHLKVFTAFSRDQKEKVYVQDRLREQADLVYRLLHDFHGIVYICGSSGKMPRAVREALVEVFTKKMLDRAAAEAYLLTMEKEGRYKQETW